MTNNKEKSTKLIVYGTREDGCAPISQPGYIWEEWTPRMGQLTTIFQIIETSEQRIILAGRNLGKGWDTGDGLIKLLKEKIPTTKERNSIRSPEEYKGLLDIIAVNPEDPKTNDIATNYWGHSPFVKTDENYTRKCAIVIATESNLKEEIKNAALKFASRKKLPEKIKVYLPEWIPGSLDWSPYCASKDFIHRLRWGDEESLKKATWAHLKDEKDLDKAIEFAEKSGDERFAQEIKDRIAKRYNLEINQNLRELTSKGDWRYISFGRIFEMAYNLRKLGQGNRADEYQKHIDGILRLAREDYKITENNLKGGIT